MSAEVNRDDRCGEYRLAISVKYRQDRRPILRLVSGPLPYVHLSKVMDAPRVSYRVGGWVKDCYLSSSRRGEGRPGTFQKGHRFPATQLCYVPIRGFVYDIGDHGNTLTVLIRRGAPDSISHAAEPGKGITHSGAD